MKRKITARTINYEMQLLRGVMMYAGCWKGGIAGIVRSSTCRKRQREDGVRA